MSCARETGRAARNALTFYSPKAPVTDVCDSDVASLCLGTQGLQSMSLGQVCTSVSPCCRSVRQIWPSGGRSASTGPAARLPVGFLAAAGRWGDSVAVLQQLCVMIGGCCLSEWAGWGHEHDAACLQVRACLAQQVAPKAPAPEVSQSLATEETKVRPASAHTPGESHRWCGGECLPGSSRLLRICLTKILKGDISRSRQRMLCLDHVSRCCICLLATGWCP